MREIELSEADKMFEELGYKRVSCIEGFFFYNGENNKTVLFDLYKKEWSVYDYDTLEPRGYGDKLLKAILKQELQLKWINIEDYKGEISFI